MVQKPFFFLYLGQSGGSAGEWIQVEGFPEACLGKLSS